MDYFAHGIWSLIFFNKTKKPWIAVLFGLLPDTLSWFIYMIYRLFTEGFGGKPDVLAIPNWMWTLYGISHSLFVAFSVIGIIYLIAHFYFKKKPIYIWAWPIAILMDIPTHSRDFLPTPFLWPFFEWYFPGISWGQTWFMITNWGIITLILIYLIHKNILKKNQVKQRE